MAGPNPTPNEAHNPIPTQTSAVHRGAVAAVLIAVALATLDTAIANTALPAIAADLHAAPAASVWVINAYQLALVATLLPFAALGDIVGQRRVLLIGLAVFVVASLACALSSTLPTLAAARVLQGLGASGVMSANLALFRRLFPPERFGRAAGLNALVVGTCFALGPSVASLVLSVASWPWLFGINVPLGLLALAVAWPTLPRSTRGEHRLDPLAALLSVIAFAALVLGLGAAAQREPAAWSIGAIAIALVAGFLLVRREAGHPSPILPVDLFRNPAFALSSLTAVCSFAAQGLAFVSLPFYFEAVLHRDQVETGFLMSPWSIVVALAAPLAGRLSDRYAPGLLGAIGLAVMGLGMASLALLPVHPGVLDICVRMALCGAGFGFFQSPNIKALMSNAPPSRSGGAGGIVSLSRLIGQTTGAALTALCFSLAGVHGSATALWLGAGFAAAAAVASGMRLLASS